MNHLDQFLDLFINEFRSLLTIWFCEIVPTCTSGIVEGKIADLFTHSVEGHHSICHLRKAFKIIESTCRWLSVDDFFSNTASDQRAHLVNHLLLGDQLTLFRKIPCCSQCLSTRDNRHLEKRICMREKPANSRMACLVMCNRSLLLRSDDLGLPFKSSDDSVHSVKEILFLDCSLVLAGCSQGCFVADIGYICT